MIRDDVQEVADALTGLVSIFFDDIPNREQILDAATKAYSVFTEGRDIYALSGDDRKLAVIDAAIIALFQLKGLFIEYSDEIEPVVE